MIKKVYFKDLFVSQQSYLNEFVATEEGIAFADETGYHIYGEVRLALSLSASEDTTNASKFLKIIQAMVTATNACALEVGAEILEVQGERVHLLLPGGASKEDVLQALSFCSNLTQILYEYVAPLAGKDWQGFATAIDHGRAILIKTGNHSNGSVISLGCAANRPAKQLNKGMTRAGYVSIPSILLNYVESIHNQKDWQEVDMLNPPLFVDRKIQEQSRGKLSEATANALRNSLLFNSKVIYADPDHLKGVLENGITSALKVQGIYIRADLDGFSKEVENAFAIGEESINALTKRFVFLMGYADQFASKLDRQVIKLPWAGDCANMVLLKQDSESYDIMRASVAPLAARDWHEQRSGFTIEEHSWKDFMGKAEWVLGIAAGDTEEGSNGHLLLAPIVTLNRKFLIAIGWGARRSLDAQNVDGAHGRDTIIPAVDFRALDSVYQKLFEPITSLFYRATQLSKQKVQSAVINASQKNETVIPRINIVTPRPKPYYQ